MYIRGRYVYGEKKNMACREQQRWVYSHIKYTLVKGPGDKLSETQKLWIDTLSTFDIAVEVCYVKVWEGEDVLLQDDQ